MYKSKKDVDKHVEKLMSKLSVKEFNTRAYSVARLYFDAGDFVSCQKYVEQYLTQKDNNAAAYKLLGQALYKMGQKEKALEQFKASLDIDQTLTGTILDICELITDEEISIDPGRAKYWYEKAESIYPRHPVTFRLREKLLSTSDQDPEALVKLLTMELNVRPMDPLLHGRLIKHYLKMNKYIEAFEHSCNTEFSSNNFTNNYTWYEILDDLLKHDLQNSDKCLYQLLLLTVKERLTLLSLTETPSGSSKGLVESADLLHAYDQALERVATGGAAPGFAEFHAALLQHHRGQFSFHAATYLLKKAKKDIISWSESTKIAVPLMLLAWQTVPLDSKVNWLKNAPERLFNVVKRWYSEGTYRCSQSGHFLLTNFRDKNHSLLDQISQCCSGLHWKDKIYEQIFTSKTHMSKMRTSHFVSNACTAPQLRLPRKTEVEAYDSDAQKEYGNSLHHFVWTLLNYKNYANFRCTLFDMLTPTVTSSGPETLNKLDIYAFLYCAALSARQQKSNELLFINGEKPNVLPANITNLLCSLPQMKWWDCAYKFSQNILGTELTDIRSTLSRGIEVVRCIDNHSLDPELLCILGRIFSDLAKDTKLVDEKNFIETRAGLYYESAIQLLEKLKNKMMVKVSEKRLFDYTHKDIGTKELNALIEECKLFVAVRHINDNEYEKAIELLTNVKSQQAYYHLAQAFKKVAQDEIHSSTDGSISKYGLLLSKAKAYAYKALDSLKENATNKNQPLYSDTQELIEDIEICLNKMDPDLSTNTTGIDGKFSSDENVTYRSEVMRTNTNVYRNISSTPKAKHNNTNYRTCMDSQILETSRADQKQIEGLESEIKKLQKRDNTITDFMEQTKSWFEENRNLGNKIINTINSNIQNTTDQFKQLKISVDQVKNQIDECRNECKDVGELKKQITELKKEVDKLKKSSSEQNVNENDLYNLDEEYRASETTSSYGPQLPFTPQMVPQFNQRPAFPVPPNPYQLYNQTLFNLYNQFSHVAQSSSMPAVQPIFDPTRAQMNFPGVYPTPDQMFLDMAHLIPPAAAAVPPTAAVPTIPVPHTLPIIPPASVISTPISTSVFTSTFTSTSDKKDTSRSLPMNVAIASSDPIPTHTSTPAPGLRVTIPAKHIQPNQPHNYQIALPTTTETQVSSPPVFSFTMPENKNNPVSTLSNWNKAFQTFSGDDSSLYQALQDSNTSLDATKSVVDGPFAGAALNTSLNKSRTLSEKSNTSVENYDPCPDFKPIVPLPAEVKVTTGEEDEKAIFSSRAKLFRFVDKQWKERGLGEIKLLKHKTTDKVRVLMRREQVHKICANHIITPEIKINPMKNETKAYIWVANDFSEEAVVLEKFCVRFKTADIAKEFYEAFEKARKESETSSKTKIEQPATKVESKQTEIKIFNSNNNKPHTEGKTTVGGFTFSSTPLFKPVENDSTKETKTTNPETNKSNVFSNLSFKTGTPQLSNLLNVTTAPPGKTSPVETTEDSNKSKLNCSDTVEEFEPTVEFKPVIALPALVEQKTGEEDETTLFEHRAKLLRYDSTTKEWKERGLGNIKLLARKDNNQKIRLLMRREQIMKVCCNHVLTQQINFQKMPNMDKAVTWCAKDFSEGELVSETFCLRFKTVQVCDEFMNVIQATQRMLKDDSKACKEEENASKQTNSFGFGDKFKAKAGSWYCGACYTNNLENFEKCACCELPKPQVASSNVTSKDPPKSSSWGDKFKPKPGSWECKACFVRNEAGLSNCTACNSAKDPTSKQPISVITATKSNFSFGIPQQTAASVQNQTKTEPSTQTTLPKATGFGDMFKPKEGSWECKQCFVRNAANSENCCACNSSKDPNAPKQNISVLDTTTAPAVKFSFGIPPTLTNVEKPKSESIFEGTGANKFSFGIPITPSGNNDMQKPITIIQEAPKMPAKTDAPLNFSMKTSDESKTTAKETGFGFVFKSTAPKSPAKTPQKQEDESDGEDLAKEEDCIAHFTPVIPLPDKVEVVTGEENEEELYGHRARLYMFVSGEWKERGTGVVKILKHKDTSKLRVVMRREQILKICLNHALTSDISYNSKDEKTWLFAANDFSEGELTLQKFCLRFSNNDIALQFKKALDNALQEKVPTPSKTDIENEQDEVVFVSETQASLEDKQKAKDLMLPENFYMYKNKELCTGCRGCIEDDTKSNNEAPKTISVAEVAAALAKQNATKPSLATPVKAKLPIFQSPTNSVYGTPGNDKTFDNSLFRTPLGSISSSTVTSTPTNSVGDVTIDGTNKENVLTQKPSIFSNFGDQKSIFGTPQTMTQGSIFGTNPTIFGTIHSSESQLSLNSKGTSASLLAPPKLSTLNTSSENTAPEPKSIFSSVQTKPTFGGISNNNSIFGSASDKAKDEKSPEVRSLFGGNETSTNLFSGTSQGSIFGPGALSNNQPKPGAFGCGETGSIFGSGGFAKSGNETNKLSTIWGPITSEQKKENEELPLNLENNLSFAALSSGPVIFEKKVDFKWEGSGQQLFSAEKKRDSRNESGAGDESGNAEDEFDPHYEPIVPLPDKIVVTTGEEDEEKVFGERGKIYRYDDKNKEWKERGVGEVKILLHPQNKTYRLLLRREQIHKAVLNMLLHADLELHPMKNTETAWTFAGRNFAENPSGEHEMLAVRFKNTNLANSFRDQVNQCVRKLQAAAAQAIREVEGNKQTQEVPVSVVKQEQETNEGKTFGGVTPLRLPKHLQDNARADNVFTAAVNQAQSVPPKAEEFWASASQKAGFTFKTETKPNDEDGTPSEGKQVHFQEPKEEEEDDDDENYDYENPDYENSDYYNEDDAYYACEGEAIVKQGDEESSCPHANIQVLCEQDSTKIFVTDADTGEILADMLVQTDTEFQMSGDTCKWTGTDCTSYEPVEKTVTINFFESESAMQFYDCVETSKHAAFTTDDAE